MDRDMQELPEMTPEELLQNVNKAIYTICVGGQSYQIGSRKLTRANLKELYDLRNSLQAQTEKQDSGVLDNCYVAVFDRR